MLKKVAFTLYPITDAPRARKFYEETLGLTIGSHGNQGDKWWIEYDLPGGGCFALTNFTDEQPSGAAGGTIADAVQAALDVQGNADLARLMATLLDAGAFTRLHPDHAPLTEERT